MHIVSSQIVIATDVVYDNVFVVVVVVVDVVYVVHFCKLFPIEKLNSYTVQSVDRRLCDCAWLLETHDKFVSATVAAASCSYLALKALLGSMAKATASAIAFLQLPSICLLWETDSKACERQREDTNAVWGASVCTGAAAL